MAYGPSYADKFRRSATYVDISKHVGRVIRCSFCRARGRPERAPSRASIKTTLELGPACG